MEISNEIKASYEKRLEELGKKYISLDEQIKLYQSYAVAIRSEMIDMMKIVGKEKVVGIKLVEKKLRKEVSIKELGSLFPSMELLEKMVVLINIEKTVENLKYVENIQEPLIKKILFRLEELCVSKFDDLEIGV